MLRLHCLNEGPPRQREQRHPSLGRLKAKQSTSSQEWPKQCDDVRPLCIRGTRASSIRQGRGRVRPNGSTFQQPPHSLSQVPVCLWQSTVRALPPRPREAPTFSKRWVSTRPPLRKSWSAVSMSTESVLSLRHFSIVLPLVSRRCAGI